MVWVFLLLHFLLSMSPSLGDPHIFTSRMCFFFLGWLVHGWFVGFVCTGYDRRLDDDLLFFLPMLAFWFFVSLAILRVFCFCLACFECVGFFFSLAFWFLVIWGLFFFSSNNRCGGEGVLQCR